MKGLEVKRLFSGSPVFSGLLALLIMAAIVVFLGGPAHLAEALSQGLRGLGAGEPAFLTVLTLAVGHFGWLILLGERLSIRSARWGFYFYFWSDMLFICFAQAYKEANFPARSYYHRPHRPWYFGIFNLDPNFLYFLLFAGLAVFPALWAFGVPARSLPGWGPLILLYLTLAIVVREWPGGILVLVPLVAIAGIYFPLHRRILEYWRPRPLPRIRRKRGAVLPDISRPAKEGNRP